MEYLYTTLIETKAIQYLTMFKFCQDHIELFFRKIRSLGGFYNNPNVRQFKSAYKKILSHLEFSSKFSGNCLPLENLPISQSVLHNINISARSYRHEDVEEETISSAFIKMRQNEEATERIYESNCDHLSRSINETPDNQTSVRLLDWWTFGHFWICGVPIT